MRRFLLFTSVAVALTVCTASAGKHEEGRKGGGGGKGARAAGAGGGRGFGAAGMGQRGGGGARANAFRGSQANGMRHEGGGQQAGRNSGQGKFNGAGRQGGATGQAMHSRGANGFRSANSTGVRRQALHSHAAFNRTQGFARVNHVHVQRYWAVVRNYHPVYHERIWWNSHYSRIVLVGGGWYYWDAGYWYPALGYDPAFQIYPYEGPIYSYDNLPPDQVIMNVQTELRFQGYYDGEIDGQLGPLTRQAIADYQRDKDLEVTEVADEPTVDSLGLA